MPQKWVPLEASPEVFNEWSQPLGLPAAPLSFQDSFSLDPEFLAFIPQPVRAVSLLFPQRGASAQAREEEEKSDEHKFDGDVWWVKQTISNACGSIGLSHALSNSPEGSSEPGSKSVQFKVQSKDLDPMARAKLLETSPFFESAHESASQGGQSAVPENVDVDTHFIAFIEAKNKEGDNRVVELDGGRTGPFDRGHCDDLLSDVAKIVKEKYIDRADGDINFNMIVLAGQGE